MTKKVKIIGVPLDLGANMRGALMGPAAIRMADLNRRLGYLDLQVEDSGDLIVPIRESLTEADHKEKFRTAIAKVSTTLADRVYDSLKEDYTPVILGGDHSIAVGSVAGASRFFREKQQKLGLLWIDAHADMNTFTSSPSGNVHGMPLAALLGDGHEDLTHISGFAPKVDPENVALLGIRNIDGREKDILRRSGINYYSMREIDERGMHEVVKEALAKITKNTSGVHLSCDLDGVDPLYAPGVSTAVTGGLSYREIHLALEMLADTGTVRSLEFVELNPTQDVSHKTADLAVDLTLSALGKSIV